MRRFWATLAVQLGKRAGLVSIVGLLVTVGLGLGITQLKFATGQELQARTQPIVAPAD